MRKLLFYIFLPLIVTAQSTAVKPSSVIKLFDGKNLDNFDRWQVDNHENDPDKVFSVVDQVDGAPAIRISGQHWGGLITKSAYRDYKLVVDFRWGLLTWGQRSTRTRDSGILLHCQGRPGNAQKDFNSPWMRSIEFQIIEGGVGDIILVGGYADNGEQLRPAIKAKTRKDRNKQNIFDPNGELNTFATGRINWWGRSEDWVDKLGFRGTKDVESLPTEWTHLEAIVEKGNLTYYVNGKLVNQASESTFTEGKLLFQSEGAEIYFRRIDLEPLP